MDEAPARSRFDAPSAGLDLGAVAARQTRKARFISLAIAIALHGSLAVWKVSAERKAIKPLTTRFIKREPRLVKPLELRKAPKPKRRRMRRRMKRVRAKVDTRGISRAPKASQVLESLVRPVATVEQAASFERPALEPMIKSEVVSVTRMPVERLDLSLEMVDVSVLDTGRDRAFVIQDPQDRRGIRGFFHIARTYSTSASVLARGGTLSLTTAYDPGRITNPKALTHLAQAVNEYTDLRVDVVDDMPLDDARLLEVPWVVFNARSQFDATESELRNLGRYLVSGGFVWADWSAYAIGVLSGDGLSVREFMAQLLEDALETQGLRQGRHWNRVALAHDHPVYHAFYDFDGPPGGNDPSGHQLRSRTQSLRNASEGQLRFVNWYVGNDGRVMAILTAMMSSWRRWMYPTGFRGEERDKREHLKFAVNVLVFALTQEGSLAKRALASAR